MRSPHAGMLGVLGLLLLSGALLPLRAQDLIFPTPNHNLQEHPEHFYMKTARGGPDPWKGGMYGFTRDAKNTSAGTIHTRFHEGVDIAPAARDERGVPIDTVVAIDSGMVVHVNPRAGGSNYGKYIVVRHIWGGSPYYSLYAHLNDTWVDSGTRVGQGYPLGRLGYTGAGINKERAHLHFEITMLVNWNFPRWYGRSYGDGENQHGSYNGINLAGVDVARLYERMAEEPGLTIARFIKEEHEPFYKVIVPRDGRLDLLWRYPWLLDRSAAAESPSWEITFDASGLPLGVSTHDSAVASPRVSWVADTPFPLGYVAKHALSGSVASPSLSGAGKRFISLLAEPSDSITYAIMIADGAIGTDVMLTDVEELERFERRRKLKLELEERRAREEREKGTAATTVDPEPVEEPNVVEEMIVEVDEPMEGSAGEPPASDVDTKSGEVTAADALLDGEGPFHVRGHSFIWILDGKRWKIEMRPIEIRTTTDDEIDGAGVDTLRAICPDCADYGISQPRLRRINDVTWGITLEVTDKKKLAAHGKSLAGRSFRIPLQMVVDDRKVVSQVTVKLAVKGAAVRE